MAKSCALCLTTILLFGVAGFSQSRHSPRPLDDKIIVGGVRVNNFYKKNQGNYNDVVILATGENTIQFDKNRGVFQLAVMAITPAGFRRNRELVEGQFLSILGITRADACKLKVEEAKNSPGGWDGKNYGLSFCPIQAPVRPRSANQPLGWDAFWSAFRAAVRARDKSALSKMMIVKFNSAAGKSYDNPDARAAALQDLDWNHLDEVIRQGVGPIKKEGGKTVRQAPPSLDDVGMVAIFELGRDGRWRWADFFFYH